MSRVGHHGTKKRRVGGGAIGAVAGPGVTRRGFLSGSLRFMVGTASVGMTPAAATVTCGGGMLKDAAANRGLSFGLATADRYLRDNPKLATLISSEAALLTPENDAKWEVLRPTRNDLNAGPLDRIAEFAQSKGLGLRGHTLVWHEQNPPWMSTSVASGDALTLLRSHIDQVMGRYRGRIHSWDVVNEAVEPDHGRSDGLRKTPWLEALGPDYVKWAFEAARRSDPETRLVYNDYGLEYANSWNGARRDATLRLIEGLKRESLIDALGVQGHLFIDQPFDADIFRTFLAEVASLGLDVYVTELDVCDKSVHGSIEQRDATIAGHLREVLGPTLKETAVKVVVAWGAMTGGSWLNGHPQYKRDDGEQTRGLPFDDQGRRTGMGDELLRLLCEAPVRA